MRTAFPRMALCWTPSAALGVAVAGDPITGFTFPWSYRTAPKTVVNSESSKERLQFTFTVTDRDIVYSDDWNGESTLDVEDRVEVFIARDDQRSDYLCIEVAPI